MKINWRLGLKIAGVILCIIVFIVLAIITYLNRLEPIGMDIAFRDFCYAIRGEENGFGYWFFRLITEFGNFYIVSVIVIIFTIKTKCDYRAIILALGVLFAVMLNIGLKGLYMRERPIAENRWMNEDSTSFPSGHSTAVGFVYSYLMYVAYHSKISNKLKNISMILCGIIIPLVMFSRTILGVHYLTDVIAGFSVGIMVACLAMLAHKLCLKYDFITEGLFEKIKNRKKEE